MLNLIKKTMLLKATIKQNIRNHKLQLPVNRIVVRKMQLI